MPVRHFARPMLVWSNSGRVRGRGGEIRLELLKGGSGELPTTPNALEELPVVDDQDAQSRLGDVACGTEPFGVGEKLVTKSHWEVPLLSCDQPYKGQIPHKSRGQFPYHGASLMRDTALMTYTPVVARILDAVDEWIAHNPEASDRSISVAADLNPTFVRDLRNGDSRDPRSASVAKLAKILGLNAQWLQHGVAPKRADQGLEVLDAIAAEVSHLDDDDQAAVLDMVRRLRRRGKPAA